MELNVYTILTKSMNKMSDPSSVKISFFIIHFTVGNNISLVQSLVQRNEHLLNLTFAVPTQAFSLSPSCQYYIKERPGTGNMAITSQI